MVDDLDREHHRSATHALVSEVLDSGRLQIALQPVVNISDNHRLGYEALSRFPIEFGTPDTLFPAAAEVGLSAELEQLAASRALALAPTLASDTFLSLNMSPTSIIAWEYVIDGFKTIAANRLVIEITEHQAIDKYDDVRRSLDALRERGIRLAIDDVGAGYASLHHVLQLEPDLIKIDRKLVDGAADDHAQRSVIRGFVGLARDIGALVIGEGVERPADLEVLRDLGVDAAQGYLLGRPVIRPIPGTDEPPTAGRRLPMQRPA
jgi:EAL domain-containing protein (putative c-di-GMP-specific phosphodiesterase class I)